MELVYRECYDNLTSVNMNHEPTTQDILDAINAFATSVDRRFEGNDQQFKSIDQQFKSIDQQFKSIDKHFESIDEQFKGIDKQFKGIDKRFNSIDERFDDIDFEIKEIKDNMVTKDELATELSTLENRITNQIDGFVTLHNTMDVELVSVRNRCDRMESFIDKAAKKLDIEYSR